MLKDRVEFIVLCELKKGTVLADFFGWIKVDLLKDTFVEMKDEGFISGEVLIDDLIVLKDIEITEKGRLHLEKLLQQTDYEKTYKYCQENNCLEDWVYGRA
ncbi:hypothetical protein ERX27_00235 [Macrococcus brunensis]|uniref:Uncharacterized protein n=1 Tax=Macrococcus brunensis TaxID=198483 RepID=A0A4V3BDM7_9STAP|nr:hypothetical protein [Macrococcus brunensis]TDL98906.1 hypothetical protein ERX27_00235 [Macrococcus brunensis]